MQYLATNSVFVFVMRNPETNKYDYGHALLVAGHYGCMGCAILAAKAALRAGCGMLTVHLPALCVDPMQVACPEAMVDVDAKQNYSGAVTTNLTRFNAIAIGPGLGNNPITARLLKHIINTSHRKQQLILDADALNIISVHYNFWESKPFINRLPPILTPHDGEYQRLFGDADPQEMAAQHNIVIVRKGHHSRIDAPDGSVCTNPTGNAGMATAGSGDVLTGILLGLAAQQWRIPDPFHVACSGVRIHGESGDIATSRQSEASLIASDLVENLIYVDP